MTQDDKKARMLAKLQKPAEPVTTQVVKVKAEKPAKAETDHFNVYPPVNLANRVRMFKVTSKKTIQTIYDEAIEMYLDVYAPEK